MGWQLARRVDGRKRPGLQQVANFLTIFKAFCYLFTFITIAMLDFSNENVINAVQNERFYGTQV